MTPALVDGFAMSALSQNLHLSIGHALNIARDHHHSHATPEHLLLALTDDPEAVPALLACNVDLTKLRDDLSMSLSAASANVLSSIKNPGRMPRSKASFNAQFVMSILWITTR